MLSLISVKSLYFPVVIYYLGNSDANFWFCQKEDLDNELVNVKAAPFSKLLSVGGRCPPNQQII